MEPECINECPGNDVPVKRRKNPETCEVKGFPALRPVNKPIGFNITKRMYNIIINEP